jgi:hypothetical protein
MANPLIAKYDVNLQVAIGRGAFALSKVVTISPSFIIVNAANSPVEVRQSHSTVILTLQPGQSRPVIWFNADAKPEMLVRPVHGECDWAWSGRFPLAEATNHTLRIHARCNDALYAIMPISIVSQVRRIPQ